MKQYSESMVSGESTRKLVSKTALSNRTFCQDGNVLYVHCSIG